VWAGGKIAQSDCLLCDACLSVNIEQLGSHRADFHEIWYLKVFRKSFQEVRGSLTTDKTDGTVRVDQYTFTLISRSVPPRMRNISGKILWRKSKHTFYVQKAASVV
jgi:hypothetical protein